MTSVELPTFPLTFRALGSQEQNSSVIDVQRTQFL